MLQGLNNLWIRQCLLQQASLQSQWRAWTQCLIIGGLVGLVVALEGALPHHHRQMLKKILERQQGRKLATMIWT